MPTIDAEPPYQHLTPDLILRVLESHGWPCDGRLLALNSYENRVYQVGIEDGAPVVAKFYRPQRWSLDAIREEHAFALELAAHELPVVAPFADDNGNTLHEAEGFLFAVYPRRGGHWPELGSAAERRQMGRMLGRLHAVGAIKRFQHRPSLDCDTLGQRSRAFVLAYDGLPAYLREAYASLTEELLERIRAVFAVAGGARLRLHGDCHPGNLLWTDDGPHFVDLDDCAMGPAVQDLWMLLSGSQAEMRVQLDDLLDGYEMFYPFDRASLVLIEPLRTLRIMHYVAWLARRWNDPAFPRAFPWFASPRYWEEHILNLREQAALLAEPCAW